MKIIVLVKQVPETDSLTLDVETGTVVRSEDTSIVNPLDLYALEAALRIKDEDPATSILALSMGPPQAESALREALAMGCDEAVLVTGREFAGSDTWATSRALSAAIRALPSVDFVFCGEKATDGDTGQVGPEVAAFLDIPVLTYVGALSFTEKDGRLVARAERLVEDGMQLLSCAAPALLSFCKALGEPRLPLLSGKRRARETAVRKLGAADLGLAVEELGAKGSPTRVVKIDRPRLARKTEFIDARSEEGIGVACDRVMRILRDAGLIVPAADGGCRSPQERSRA
jgi:electron transfer flavoprotein beta subunit